ncbi:hypothetical protein [Streptomyces sp. 049-1]|uniref:hypothetical protein n=1 Tax=Streptomyces sp. 049-1 TaxID=2789264 RepID=UPI0039805861
MNTTDPDQGQANAILIIAASNAAEAHRLRISTTEARARVFYSQNQELESMFTDLHRSAISLVKRTQTQYEKALESSISSHDVLRTRVDIKVRKMWRSALARHADRLVKNFEASRTSDYFRSPYCSFPHELEGFPAYDQ